ncbi:hypothetical protein EZV62_000863 [Acer yangbiense]|uniref:Fe2OG dioxygenase domain-containing protein n=1 Tax=Acer yangbiense TaxID=1000413 RepID=A0A5C7ITZ6_9ROSI|nr:hypothetical protein EZV62_000863 [Acer yangbiense]
MEVSVAGEPFTQTASTGYDRAQELKAFDDTEAGVKGLVDAGIVNIPRIFIRPSDELVEELNCQQNSFQVPLIDLDEIKGSNREEIVYQIRTASETWGFFQVVNHGIPLKVLEDMIQGVRDFNEQDVEMKKQWYSRDQMKRVRFNSNFDLYQSRTANWRDTLNLSCSVSHNFDPEELPAACRETTLEYIKHVRSLGDTLFEIISEALGLKSEHLQDMECGGASTFVCHYYPPCPEPELTMGTSSHSDPAFLTILLQDQIGGLQVLHQNQWVDVNPISGGLVVNIGDFLQVISNEKLKSVDHRVIASGVGPRVSVACFFAGSDDVPPRLYGPIKELISEENPPLYQNFLVPEYFAKYAAEGLNSKSCLEQLKL